MCTINLKLRYKSENECYTLVEKFHYLVKTNTLWILRISVALFVFMFYLKFCCIFPERFLCIQIRFELLPLRCAEVEVLKRKRGKMVSWPSFKKGF